MAEAIGAWEAMAKSGKPSQMPSESGTAHNLTLLCHVRFGIISYIKAFSAMCRGVVPVGIASFDSPMNSVWRNLYWFSCRFAYYYGKSEMVALCSDSRKRS